MRLREYESSDCTALAELLRRVVHKSCSGDYTAEQLDAWASGNVGLRSWNESFQEHSTIVAEEGGEIIGFGDIDSFGYLDRLFVREDWQRKGVASVICDELECTFAGKRVTVCSSLTARPFFEARGYIVTGERQISRGGIALSCYDMEKQVPSDELATSACCKMLHERRGEGPSLCPQQLKPR